jgi:hypothetical protein
LFPTLLGNARSVSAQWADLLEPWQPKIERRKDNSALGTRSFYGNPGGESALSPSPSDEVNRTDQFRAGAGGESDLGFSPIGQAKFLGDGTEILSDALPDSIDDGQRYAAGGSSGRGTRGGRAPPEGPVGRFLSGVYEGKLRALTELEPNNRFVTGIQSPDWRPSQRDIDRIEEELIRARQRTPGAVDTQASGIGIGPFARESIPARSGKRDFSEEERIEVTRLGYLYGCHTCGTRDPGTGTGYFTLDHQRATRLNPFGEGQRLFPQCLSCMRRQGGLISSEVRRESQ